MFVGVCVCVNFVSVSYFAVFGLEIIYSNYLEKQSYLFLLNNTRNKLHNLFFLASTSFC